MKRGSAFLLAAILLAALALSVGAEDGQLVYPGVQIQDSQVLLTAVPLSGGAVRITADGVSVGGSASTVAEAQPGITYYCVVDTSRSFSNYQKEQQLLGLNTLSDCLGEKDSMVLITMGREVSFGQRLTDPEARREAIQAACTYDSMGTNLFEAIDTVLRTVAEEEQGFRCIVFFTDGIDDSIVMKVNEDQAGRFIQGSGMSVNFVALLTPPITEYAGKQAQRLERYSTLALGGACRTPLREGDGSVSAVVEPVQDIVNLTRSWTLLSLNADSIPRTGKTVELTLTWEGEDGSVTDTVTLNTADLPPLPETEPVTEPMTLPPTQPPETIPPITQPPEPIPEYHEDPNVELRRYGIIGFCVIGVLIVLAIVIVATDKGAQRKKQKQQPRQAQPEAAPAVPVQPIIQTPEPAAQETPTEEAPAPAAEAQPAGAAPTQAQPAEAEPEESEHTEPALAEAPPAGEQPHEEAQEPAPEATDAEEPPVEEAAVEEAPAEEKAAEEAAAEAVPAEEVPAPAAPMEPEPAEAEPIPEPTEAAPDEAQEPEYHGSFLSRKKRASEAQAPDPFPFLQEEQAPQPAPAEQAPNPPSQSAPALDWQQPADARQTPPAALSWPDDPASGWQPAADSARQAAVPDRQHDRQKHAPVDSGTARISGLFPGRHSSHRQDAPAPRPAPRPAASRRDARGWDTGTLPEPPAKPAGQGGVTVRLTPDGNPGGTVYVTMEQGSSRTLGRNSKSDIILNARDTSLSGLHFELQWDGRVLYLTDRDSTNGTSLTGIPQRPGRWSRVESGSTIQAGSTRYKVKILRE